MKTKQAWQAVSFFFIITIFCIGIVSSCAKDKDHINVGVILNLTGPLSIADQPKKQVLETALEYLQKNAQAGDPVNRMRLLFEDAHTDPKAGISAFHKLYDKGVRIFITGSSFNAMPLLPITEEKKCILFGIVGHPAFTQDTRLAIRLYPRVELGSEKMVEVLNKDKVRSIYVLHTNEPFGKSYADELKKRYKGYISGINEFEIAQKDFRNILAKVRTSGAERLVVIGFGIGEQNLIKQMIESKITTPILGNEVFYYAISAMKAGNSVDFKTYSQTDKTIFLAPAYIDELNSSQGNQFVDYYKSKHNGAEPQIFGVFGADGLSLLQKVLSSSSNYEDIDAMRNVLTSLINVQGFTGRVNVLPNGNIDYPLIVMKLDRSGNIIRSTN